MTCNETYSRTRHWTWTAMVTMALAIGGCASLEPAQTSDVRLPSPGADKLYTVEFPEQSGGADRHIRITIGADVYAQCQQLAPHFPVDSSRVLPQDRIALNWVAACLKTSPLNEYDVRLIGHADPRGDAEHNRALGQARAETVRNILVREGVPAVRLITATRGEVEAVGDQPEYEYGYDRRVDIVVVGQSHAPGAVARKDAPSAP